MAMSSKPLKFPLELYDHPIVRTLNTYQAGLFRLLIESYWKTGIELPESNNALMRLSNADYKAFKKYVPKVKEALREVMPEVIKARSSRQRNRVTFQKCAEKARVKRKIKGQRKETTFSDENENKKLIITAVPKTHEETAWNKGQFDPIMRKMALQNNEANKGKRKLFYDKPKD